MKRKFIKSLAAAAAAFVMAGQAMALNVSAETYYYYSSYTGKYYTSYNDAVNASNGITGYVSYVGTSAPGSYYSSYTGKYYTSYSDAVSASNGNAAYVSYVGNGIYNGTYYSSYTGKYYSTYEAALNDSKGVSSYITYVGGAYNGYPYYTTYYNGGYYSYSEGYHYYNTYTKKYYKTYYDAVNATDGASSYVVRIDGYNNGYFAGGYYYSTYTGRHYNTYSDALAASKNDSKYVVPVGDLYYRDRVLDSNSIYKFFYKGVGYATVSEAEKAGGTIGVDIYYSTMGNAGDVTYYYYYNGKYYGSLSAAKNAGGHELGDDISKVPYNYYGNAYKDTYLFYGDPYTKLANGTTTKTSSSKAEPGTPFIYGKSTRAGWTTIKKSISSASKGSNIKVDMNGCKEVDKSVLETIKGKNVSVTFVLDNGVKWTVNGNDVTSAKQLVIDTTYNIDYIPAGLVKKAASGAVAKAQVGVSNNYDSFGTDASITVKFSENRAGCTATVYRYNVDANSLKSAYKAKVQSNGTCTFTVDQGGAYLIVLK